MPMTSKVAATLVAVSTFAVAVGTFLISADKAPFGIDAYDTGLALNWAGIIANFAVVSIRRDLIPGWTTGVGTEPTPGTDTLKIETTHTPATGGE